MAKVQIKEELNKVVRQLDMLERHTSDLWFNRGEEPSANVKVKMDELYDVKCDLEDALWEC
jgi:hypothetical protein